jgi:glycerophosphoryl diester phosphodiesterase
MQDGATAGTGHRPGARPLIVAHRGAWGVAPQNSLEAFERAIALGCDGIEVDVRRTVDGRFVIVHDARVAGRSVGRLRHQQLQDRMKAGQAPLLEEVLELVAGRIRVDLELKDDDHVDQAMALVRRRLDPDQYVVTSFRDDVLAAVRRSAPGARIGLLIGPRLRVRELEHRVRIARASFVAPHVALARRGMLRWAAQRDLPVWLWTVNDARALRTLSADDRVSALITDRPERALRNARHLEELDEQQR